MGRSSNQGKVWAALVAIYLIWGSTYLAIRVAVHPTHGEGVPPLLLAGVRFTLAGVVMIAATARRPAADGAPDPLGWRQWYAAAVIGIALPFGGNGLVTLAERKVPSGITAVMISTIPIWAALIAAAIGRERMTGRHFVGLVLGFTGVGAMVIGTGSGRASGAGILILVIAALSWAAGTVWSTNAPTPRRPLVTTGMEMLCGGIACLITAAALGEFAQFHTDELTAHAWLAFAYLTVIGSLVAYSAYVWLLRNAQLSLVTTYAFVNPVVAVILGSLILDEPFTIRTGIATCAVVVGVILTLTRGIQKPLPHAGDRAPDEVHV
ncbi:MAG TPA: EamA family transporter [Mycobacteriales bacterium]|nr:EamA family transporter [Mycobacteriales bacterium]